MPKTDLETAPPIAPPRRGHPQPPAARGPRRRRIVMLALLVVLTGAAAALLLRGGDDEEDARRKRPPAPKWSGQAAPEKPAKESDLPLDIEVPQFNLPGDAGAATTRPQPGVARLEGVIERAEYEPLVEDAQRELR